MRAALPLTDMLEKDWQAQVVELSKTLGWRRPMHIFDSRRSEPGWPDLALVRDRLVLVECKRETGRLTVAQIDWVVALTAAGVETYVARPRHLHVLAQVLQARGPVDRWTADQREARGHLLLELDPILKAAA